MRYYTAVDVGGCMEIIMAGLEVRSKDGDL